MKRTEPAAGGTAEQQERERESESAERKREMETSTAASQGVDHSISSSSAFVDDVIVWRDKSPWTPPKRKELEP